MLLGQEHWKKCHYWIIISDEPNVTWKYRIWLRKTDKLS